MLWLYTSKRFIDADEEILEPAKYFDDTVIEKIKSDDFEVEDIKDELHDVVGWTYREDLKNVCTQFTNIVKVILSLKYTHEKQLETIFDIDKLTDAEVLVLLPFAEKYKSRLLSRALSIPLIFSEYKCVLNNSHLCSHGNQVWSEVAYGDYEFITNEPVSEHLEVDFHAEGVVYNLELKARESIVFCDNTIVQKVIRLALEKAIVNKGASCKIAIITDDNYEEANKKIKQLKDTKNIALFVDYTLPYLNNGKNKIKLDIPNFEGVIVHLLTGWCYRKGEYKDLHIAEGVVQSRLKMKSFDLVYCTYRIID